jgi:sigma-E factor negative regulatory protein RseC
MTEENTICKEGIVRAIRGKDIDVEITVSSACSECHAKSICMPPEQRQEFVTAQALYGEAFELGERVHLVLKQRAGWKAILIAYLIPFLVLIAALFGSYAIFRNELASVIASLLFLVAYYFLLKHFRHKIDKQFTFFVTKLP